jgi:enediyne biosynthesis protein E4
MTFPPRSPSRVRCLGPAVLGLFVAACIGLPACTKSPSPTLAVPEEPTGPAWFEDVTDASGLNFVHDPGPVGTYFMPQSMGSGVAVFDCDGDGLMDVYLLQFGGPASKSVNRLYRQTAPGKFADATEGSGLGVPGYNHGVAVGDVNNDGKPDVVLTQFAGVRLFLNLGGGKFIDATEGSGLANLSWAMSAAFLDYDRDGWLDLVVVNYLDYDPAKQCRSPAGVQDYCAPNAFPPTSSKLFRNRGPAAGEPRRPVRVAYEDVSFASEVGRVLGPGLGVTAADFTGDGWPDVFVANDGQPNRLWVNQKNSTFAEEAVSRGVAYNGMSAAFAGMGVAVGDTDNDGMLDLYVTHLGSETNNLWRQSPRGLFRDKTAAAGLAGTKWRGTGFGTVMADFDQDGSVDIAIANGRVARGGPAAGTALGFWETYAEKNQLLANDGTGKFRDVSTDNPTFCGDWNVARGLACADLDDDGALDLVVSRVGEKARVYRNVAPDRGHWLKVRAIDPSKNRDAYGAEVRVRAEGREFLRVVNPAESYLSSGSPVLHFGLGRAADIESILVTWPDGSTNLSEVFAGGQADRAVVLKRGEGKPQ